jgi:hypothetical protein
MMNEIAPDNDSKEWRRFLRRHWQMFVLFVVSAVSAVIGAVYVFLWFAANAQSGSMVPKTLGLWSMAHLLTFMLNLIFWEIVLVGVPVAIASLAGWWWWRRLQYEEKKEYHFFNTPSRSSGGGGVLSLLFWIAFSIRIYLDGNWNIAIATWTLDYFVYTSVWTVIWIMIIFGIPASVIGIIWWITKDREKKP